MTKARLGDIDGARLIFETQRGQGASVDRARAEPTFRGRAGAAWHCRAAGRCLSDDAHSRRFRDGSHAHRSLDDGKVALDRAGHLTRKSWRSAGSPSRTAAECRRRTITFGEKRGGPSTSLYALDIATRGGCRGLRTVGRPRRYALTPLHGYSKQLSGIPRRGRRLPLALEPSVERHASTTSSTPTRTQPLRLAVEYLNRAASSKQTTLRSSEPRPLLLRLQRYSDAHTS